jgi:hypothetical protein
MNKRLMGITVLVGFVFSCLMVTGAFAAKDEIVFTPSFGKVTFTHKKHSETLKIDCLKCHHTWKPGETSGKKCLECHKAGVGGKGVFQQRTPFIKPVRAVTTKQRRPINLPAQLDAPSAM